MVNQVRTILIVGGGSSGWMTAALLRKRLPQTEITLVEASDIPVIGVGESTNPTIRYFMSELGYDENDERRFMRACDASFKMAIRFQNFSRLGGVFYHPFGRDAPSPIPDFMPGAQTRGRDFAAVEVGSQFSREFVYSYQIDAGLFAEHLKQECKRNGGIRHVVDRVGDVRLAEAGDIAAIGTQNNGELTADLYIDCTGFRAALLGAAMQEPFESYGSYLLNDRAVAVRVPYIDKEKELVTHTNCTALSAGWVWNIPLWSRIGMGYVYSGAYLSSTEAENEMRQFIGEVRSRDLQFNHLKIRTGRHARGWVGNCVAIGISYGFLEPLESTGLSLTQISIKDLVEALSSGVSLPVEREMYNHRQRRIFDSTRDFIMAHYVLTERDDTPYWRHVRYDIPLPERLVCILADARARSYQTIMNDSQCFYLKESWNCILSGMGFFGEDRTHTPKLPAEKYKSLAQSLQEDVFAEDDTESIPAAVASPQLHSIWYPTW
jgi:tryptophan 6-halogenase